MKKILNEWKKYLKETDTGLSEERVEQHRMMIADRIFHILQKPSRQRANFPQELPFLYYLYKGVHPVTNSEGQVVRYKIGDGANAAAVMQEIQKRVKHFVVALDPPEDKIFAADALMMGYYMQQNKSRKTMGLATAYGVAAPGDFDTFIFGKARRSFFQPFKKDLDFMLKKSPELSNIPEQDRHLFEMQTMIGEVLKMLPRDPNVVIPMLSEDEFKANYLEGIPLKDWQSVQDRIVHDPTPDQQVGESILHSIDSMINQLYQIQQGQVPEAEALESKRNISSALQSKTFTTPAVLEHPKYKELIGLAGLVGVWNI
jgi:hypothetical protein